jgi:pimeloyl-ACP methyl ester carboxylesterase
VIVPYVGDIVRYVRANPATVAKREEVRKRGLALLRKLHGEKDPKGNPLYNRIVIVAHSLGAFVAYDLLQYLWEELGPNHNHGHPPDDSVVAKLGAVDAFVKDEWSATNGGTSKEFKLEGYRAAQLAVFHALVNSRQGWRVSDFITLGSPIVHSEFLIADSRAQMERSFEERLLSSSPPRPDRPSNSMLYHAHKGKQLFAHFAAPFAAVRWTNIYDYNWFPLLGDIVSGPVPAAFGPGVAEHQVWIKRSGWPPVLRRFVTHTLYWAWQHGYETENPPRHLALVREALALKGLPAPEEGPESGA